VKQASLLRDCHMISGFLDIHVMTNLSGVITIILPTKILLGHVSLRLC
jgi:hypothetical protein